MPALLIKESIFPHFSDVFLTTFKQSASLDTSDLIINTSAPNDSQLFATSLAESIELEHVIVIFHPFDESFFATSAPTPLLEPVIIATGLLVFI